jgi:hypothetical protein
MANPNLQLLTDADKLLRSILGELVFVGGCATALLITDSAAADVYSNGIKEKATTSSPAKSHPKRMFIS